MMDQEQYIEIAGKIADGTASEEEIALYNSYYNAYQLKYPSWEALSGPQRKAMVDETEKAIHHQLQEANESKTVKLWPRIRMAAGIAAAVAAITLGVWFYHISHNPRHPDTETSSAQAAVNDIAPGNYGATITLANGETIALDSAKKGVIVGGPAGAGGLTYSDNSAVTKDGRGADGNNTMLTASTAKGQTYQFTLPDGTKVWLNADSKISFPTQFSGTERKILLSGEGYFEVAHNAKMPFRVESERQTIHVLGTHFNVNAYTDEMVTTTTLLEGSVKITAFDVAAGRTTLMLKPNQQSILNNNGAQVLAVNASEAVAWKNGEFVFNSEPIGDIMRRVQRWYDVEVVYKNPALKDVKFSGTISRYTQISGLLEMLKMTKRLQFKVEGRRIYVEE